MLDPCDRSLLDFERAWTSRQGPKDLEIEFSLGLTARSYYERLLSLMSDQSARDYDPLTILRLSQQIERPMVAEAVG